MAEPLEPVPDVKPQHHPKLSDASRALNAELQDASGCIKSQDPLVHFLYLLIRDHLPAGAVESLARSAVENADSLYSNGWLAQYVMHVARLLQQVPVESTTDFKALLEAVQRKARAEKKAAHIAALDAQLAIPETTAFIASIEAAVVQAVDRGETCLDVQCNNMAELRALKAFVVKYGMYVDDEPTVLGDAFVTPACTLCSSCTVRLLGIAG